MGNSQSGTGGSGSSKTHTTLGHVNSQIENTKANNLRLLHSTTDDTSDSTASASTSTSTSEEQAVAPASGSDEVRFFPTRGTNGKFAKFAPPPPSKEVYTKKKTDTEERISTGISAVVGNHHHNDSRDANGFVRGES
jgi:hypothetical protein